MRSHELASKASKSGHLSGEIVTVQLKKSTVTSDEGVREKTSIEDMQKLKPSFKKDGGVVTPGTASGIVDGSAVVMIAGESFVRQNNLKPLAEIGDHTVVGVDPTIMGIGPVPAIRKLFEKTGRY